MNKETSQLITSAASFLQTKYSRKYRDFLRSPLATAVDILAVIEDAGTTVTIADISAVSGISIGTVTDTLRSLKHGGYPLSIQQAGTSGNKYLITKN